MDPLSITSAIVTFWEAGVRLKTSIEKVGRIRQRTQEILEDVSSLLIVIKDFCDANKVALESTASIELRTSLDDLKIKLLRTCEKCERMVPSKPSSRLRRLSAGFALWKQSDDIEAELLRLKESMQGWLDRMHMFATARSELAIAQLGHETLVSLEDSRSHIKQLDDLFCQLLCATNPQYTGIYVRHLDQLDDACGQYVHLKITKIHDALSERPRVLSILPGAYESIPCLQTNWHDEYTAEPKKFEVIPLVRRISESYQSVLTTSSPRFPIVPIMDLLDDLRLFGLNTPVFRCFQCFVRDLRSSLHLQTHGPLRKELLLWLRYALHKEWELCFLGSWVTENFSLAEDLLTVTREISQLSTTNDEALRYQRYLGLALRGYSIASYRNTDTATSVQYAQEALKISMPTYRPGYTEHLCSTYCPSDTPLRRAGLLQEFADYLFWSACLQSEIGDYCQACRFGRDAIQLIEDLTKYTNSVPSEFDFLDWEYDWLRTNLPTWVSIVRNPVAHSADLTSLDVDGQDGDVDVESGNNRYIEWGIAL